MTRMRASVCLLVLVAGAAGGAVFSGCDLRQEVAVGASYYINTPRYPSRFNGAYACRWTAVAPANARIVLSCDPFSLPATGQCTTARLSVSTSGDASLSDAHLYCGEGAFSQTSDVNRMVLALQTTAANVGSRFSCTVTAVQQAVPTSCSCGIKKQTRIVGGKETGVNEYPMMCALVDIEAGQLQCGATIISRRHVLTAAHCLVDRRPDEFALLVGDHDIASGTETNTATLVLVDRLVSHPGFNASSLLNDIAVVRVVGQINFNTAVSPVCLPFQYTYTDFQGLVVQALGWGTTSFGGPRSDVLMETNLTVLGPSACGQDSQSAQYQMCTYEDGKDACQADSGGPLMWQDPYSLRLQLVGIISFGNGCGSDEPSHNTRVTSYLRWISDVTKDEFCIA